LVPKHDVIANADLLGLALEGRAIGLAVLPEDERVRRPDHEVDEIGTGSEGRRERADHGLDALVRSEQPERQQHAMTRHAELGLELVLVARRHVRNPVRDGVDPRPAYVVAAREQVGGDATHHDDDSGLGHLLHDRPLRVRRIL